MEDPKNSNEDSRKFDVRDDSSRGITPQSKSTTIASVTPEKKSRKRSRSDSPLSPKKLLSFISPASSFLAQVKSSPEKKAKSKKSEKKSEKTKKNKSKRRDSKKSKRSRTDSRTVALQNVTEHNRPVTPKDTPPASPPTEPEPSPDKTGAKRPPLNETEVAASDGGVETAIAYSPLGQTPPELKSSPSSPESNGKPISSGASFPPSFKVTSCVADLIFASLEKRPPKKSGSDIPALEYEHLRKQFSKKILEVFRSSKPHSKSRIEALAEIATKKAYLYKSTEKIIAKQMDKVMEGNFEGIVACLYLVDAIVSQAKKKYGKNKEKFSARLLSTVMEHLNRTMEMQLPISLSTKASDLIAEKTIELQRIKKEALRLVNNWLEKKAFRDPDGQLLRFRKKWQTRFPTIRKEKFHPSLSVKTKKLRLNIPKELEVTESPPSPPRSSSPVVLPPLPVIKPPALAAVRPPPIAFVRPPALPPAAPPVSKPSPTVSAVMAVIKNPVGYGVIPAPPPPPPKNPPTVEVDSLESRVKALSQASQNVFSFPPRLPNLGILPLVRPLGPLLSAPPPPNGFLQPLPSLPLPIYTSFVPMNAMGPSAGLLPFPVNMDGAQIPQPNTGSSDQLSAFYKDIRGSGASAPKTEKEEVRNVPFNIGIKGPNPSTVPQALTVSVEAETPTVNSKPPVSPAKPPEPRLPDPLGNEADWRRWCGFAPKPRSGYYSVVTRMLHVRVLPKDREADHNQKIIYGIFSHLGRVDVTVDPLNNFAVITMENRARAHMAKREVLGNNDFNRNRPDDNRWEAKLDTEERFTLNAIRSGRMQLDWYPGDHIKKIFSQYWEVSPYGCAYIPWTVCCSTTTNQNRISQQFDPEKFRQFVQNILAADVAAILPDSLNPQGKEQDRPIYGEVISRNKYFSGQIIFPNRRTSSY